MSVAESLTLADSATDGFWHRSCAESVMMTRPLGGPATDRSRSSAGKAPASGDRPAPGIILSEGEDTLAGPPRLMDRLTPAERERLLSLGQRRVYERGRMLFSQGDQHDGIFLIESGLLRVFYTAPSGREITLAYWHPGNFVGGPEIFGGTHMWSAIAARSSAALMLPGPALRSLAARMPNLALGLIDGLVFKGKCYSALAQILGTRSVTERLAQLLLHLADTYGVPESDGVLIGAAFRHEDLAHMVGATRQWVTISLKRLHAAGVIRSAKGRIILLRRDLLSDPHRVAGIAI
jgi:CRP/FNR family transcriptional regulator, cyclic AMP receptor protein